MAYDKGTWINGVTPANSGNLTRLEDGVYDNSIAIAVNASAIQDNVDALSDKVDDSQVLTNVPSGALFTDTTYSVGDGGLTENNLTSALKTNYDAAYTHSQAAHAPADADNTSSNETSHADVPTKGSVNVYTKAQRTEPYEMFLQSFYSPAAMDMEDGNDFYFNLIEGDLTIGAPTNMDDNQSGIIEIEQDATGGHDITWNAIFSFMNTPDEDTTGLKRNYYSYHVYRGKILISYIGVI